MIITNALPEHAKFIGRAVAEAIGSEICSKIAGSFDEAAKAFASLAGETDTQYSFRNAIVALTSDNTPIGVCIFYDGARLDSLRHKAISLFRKCYGYDFATAGNETESGEIYIDTLAVKPEHRRKGIAAALIGEVTSRAKAWNLPVGLLVDHDNTNAQRLYERCRFKVVGQRQFAGTVMHHMQNVSDNTL